MKHNYDFVAIGDITTDAFIRIKEATVNCDINREHCMLSLRFGDKIPYEAVYVIPAVGNAANAAVAAARLDLKSALVTNIGAGHNGKQCLDVLEAEKVSTEFVAINKNKHTNYHYVLWYEEERTILIKHELYDYEMQDVNHPRWIYFSSMGENSLSFHDDFADYLEAHPTIKLAFQPGTFQMKFGRERLQKIYRRTEVLFCNKEEYQRILETKEEDVKTLLAMMRQLGPKIAVLTDGPKGAYTYDGSEYLFLPAYPDPKPPFERTGAGDAFSSTFTVALALGHDIRTALMWGPVNSMSVVQRVGARAGLLKREELEEYLKKAPDYYVPNVI